MVRFNVLNLEKAFTFFKVWTPEMAYVLGVLYADGCITVRADRFGYFEVVLELKDVEFLETVAHTIDPNIRVKVYERKDGRRSGKFSIGIKEIVNDCVALGLRPRKTADLEWPAALPPHLEADFVRGYFDGDGTVSWSVTHGRINTSPGKLRTLAFACGSKSFADSLTGVIRRNTGAEPIIQHISNCYQVGYRQKDSIRAIGEWMYAGHPLRLERKYDKWHETLLLLRQHAELGL